MCVFVWICVGECVFVCFWKNRLRYQKTAVLGWGKHVFSSTLVQYIIIFVLLCSIFIVIQKFTNTTLILWFIFLLHHRLYILSWCSPLPHWEGRLSRSYSFDFFHFYMEIITLHFVCTCVNLCFSHFSSLQATTKIDYMKYLLLCMCFVIKYSYRYN